MCGQQQAIVHVEALRVGVASGPRLHMAGAEQPGMGNTGLLMREEHLQRLLALFAEFVEDRPDAVAT